MDYRKLTCQILPTGIQIPPAAYMKNFKDVGENSFPYSPNLKISTTKLMTTTSMRPCVCLKLKSNLLFLTLGIKVPANYKLNFRYLLSFKGQGKEKAFLTEGLH